MVSTIENTDVKQKDADRAVVVALTSRSVFESTGDGDEDMYGVGVAFPLLKALQRVNDCLLEKNPAESLLFDVILITTDSQHQQQSSRIISSTRQHSLEVGRFCFSCEEDFVQSLLKYNVQMFLTTDRNEAAEASHKGVLSALLDQQVAFCTSEQLRVMFCMDAVIRPHTGSAAVSQQNAQRFSAHLGAMQQRFGLFNSPLSIILVTSHGGRESCSSALKMLRSHGVSVDEAYCLAGAPRGPILSLRRPHFLLSDCFSGLVA